ncbi:MAG: hypothetical protein AB3N19_01515 [Ruegeria sp.]
MSASIIPPDTKIGRQLRSATGCRIVLIAGLPSTGKSLLFQQLTILADEAGRTVHTLQWDDARRDFETEKWLGLYPEHENLTHPGIRKAVGFWVRDGIRKWDQTHSEAEHLLVIELPVVGGRFIELLRKDDDAIESLLASTETCVLVPVPTNALRQKIEAFRADTFSNPRNEQEKKDAPPHIVHSNWVALRKVYNRWEGLSDDATRDARYEEEIVRSVFGRLCRFRNTEFLTIDRVFATTGSAYERPVPVLKTRATEDDVEAAFARLRKLFPDEAADKAVDGWSDY